VNGDVDSLFTAGSPAGTSYATLNSVLGISNSFTVNAKFDPDNGGDKRRIRDGAEATVLDAAPGNASIIQSWIAQTDQLRSFDVTTDMTQSQSIMSSVREFVSYSSLKNQNELRNFTYEEGKLNSLKDIRDNLEGVNIDEQTQQMLLMQKIYEANAVLLKTANEMLQTLLDINR
jgi:flagellar hook-associated protein 1 FlgK